jgi:hypothetical protein
MILDQFPPGITGFFDHSEPPRALERSAFKRACYLVAQVEGGSVEVMDLDLLGRSYYAATLRTSTDHVSVLSNSVYPYLAFVPPGSFGMGFADLTFIAPVSLAAGFAALTEFQPLDADWLNTELCSGSLTGLAEGELGQVKYWKPERVGDLIFNRWD